MRAHGTAGALPRAHGRHADRPRVNVFPSAVRDVVAGFVPAVSGHVLVRPSSPGVKQDPPLPVAVEVGRDRTADPALAEAIRERLRHVLVVQARVELVPWGTLPRSDYKTHLVDH